MYGIYIYGNMDPINIPPYSIYTSTMDPMGMEDFRSILMIFHDGRF